MKKILNIEVPTTREEYTMFALQHNFNPFEEGLVADFVKNRDFTPSERNEGIVEAMRWVAETLKDNKDLVEYFVDEDKEVVLFIARVFICVLAEPTDNSDEYLEKNPITRYIISVRDLILVHGTVREESDLIRKPE